MKPNSEEEIFVAIFWSPFIGKLGYRGSAVAISSVNKVGKFDILPAHTNFISLIFDKIIIHLADKTKLEYEFKRGVLEVSENLVKVFLGI